MEMFQQFSNNDKFSICNPIGTWYGGFKVDSQVACFFDFTCCLVKELKAFVQKGRISNFGRFSFFAGSS